MQLLKIRNPYAALLTPFKTLSKALITHLHSRFETPLQNPYEARFQPVDKTPKSLTKAPSVELAPAVAAKAEKAGLKDAGGILRRGI